MIKRLPLESLSAHASAPETHRALLLAWLVMAAACSATLIAPLLIPESFLLQLSAAVQAPDHVPGSCPLCGMTRAFIAIARGDFAAAVTLNRGAIPLAVLFVMNALVACRVAGRHLRPSPRLLRSV